MTAVLPEFPDAGALRTDAARVAASGGRAKGHGQDLASIWAGLRDAYQAPEQEIVHGAMDKVVTFTDAAAEVTDVIRNALDTFADAVDALRPRYNALVAAMDARACGAPPEDEEGVAAAEAEDARLAREGASIAAEFRAAEEACAAAISGVHQPLWELPGGATSPYAAVSSGLLSQTLASIHRNPGPRLIRVALDPGSNRRRLNVPGSVTLRINGRPHTYFPSNTLIASVLAPLGPRALTVHRPVLRDPEVRGARRRRNPDGSRAALPQLPSWAAKAANSVAVIDGALAIYKNGTEQWNQDQLEHPEYDLGQRVGSATATAVVEGGGSFIGSGLGTAAGAALGSLIPIPVVGTVVGAAVGGWIGGAIGEGVGNTLRNIKDKGATEAIKGGIKEAWENLKLW